MVWWYEIYYNNSASMLYDSATSTYYAELGGGNANVYNSIEQTVRLYTTPIILYISDNIWYIYLLLIIDYYY